MADDKKYYYLKLKDDFFTDEAMIILQGMPDGYIYSDILMKLYLRSLKSQGRLMFNDLIPYTPDILAQLVRHQVGTVEKALDIFERLGLIEILDNGAIFMLNIQNFIGKSSTEADRKREYRARIEQEKQLLITGQASGQMSGQNSPEIEIEREIDIEIEKERESPKITCQQIADLYNDTCVSFPRLKTLSDTRKKAIKARLKTYTLEDFKTLFLKAEASGFLKGSNDRNWSATFDWLIKDNNMAKVLEGNYDDKPKQNGKRKEIIPSWMSKNQQEYDFEELENDLLANKSDLTQRVEELKRRIGGEENSE